MVRKRGFEPPRGCPRQPLKLVRLPFRHFRVSRVAVERIYFGCCVPVDPVAGVAAGVVLAPLGAVVPAGVAVPAGAGVVAGAVIGAFGTGGADVPLTTEPEPPRPMIDSIIAVSMNNADRIAVAFDNSVAPERAPKAELLPPPPNDAAMSPLPC